MTKNKTKIIIASIAAIIIGVIGVFLILPMLEEEEVYDEKVYDNPIDELMQKIEYDGEADYDSDGLKNDFEKELGLALYSADTDGDGLGDLYEVEESKTDPLKADTDGDTLSDFVELVAGLNPLKRKTDGTPDEDRVFKETLSKDNITVKLDGSASIYDVYVGDFEVTGLKTTPGVMSGAVEYYTTDELQAEIEFKYDEDDISNKGGSVENLAIYSFEGDGTFKKVNGSKINTENKTVSAVLKKSSKYLLCDSKKIGEDAKTSIMLLIDNSGSMYPEEMCEGSDENDVDFKRLDMAKSIIENIDDDVEYGLAKFTATYFNMAPIGTAKRELFSKIESIRTVEEEFNGTYIATSIMSAVDSFTDSHKGKRKFIIILTDGDTTEDEGWDAVFNPNEDDAIDKCKEKNISVITIGLGNKVDSEYLQKISSQTGGAYIYANNDSALEDVYKSIITQLVYSAEDTDNDKINDSYVMADSGFNMSKDAFRFENFCAYLADGTVTEGFCYGMALMAQTFYNNSLNLDGEAYNAELGNIIHKDLYSFAEYDISDCLKDVKNLRDYRNDVLETYQTYYNMPRKDKYHLDNGVLKLNDDVLETYDNKYFRKHTYSCEEKKWGDGTYTKCETLIIDIKEYLESGEKNDDMEMVCAIYWNWGVQVSPQEGIEFIDYSLGSTNEDGFMEVVERIGSGIPLIVTYQMEEGGHAINAMRILRDIDDPQVFYLECYDNNDSTNPVYFKIESKRIGFWAKTSYENWSKHYQVKSYMKNDDDEWEAVRINLQEVIVP